MQVRPIHTATVIGVEGHPIQVEVDLLRRLPSVSIVGLPDGAIRESADRIRSAMQRDSYFREESGYQWHRLVSKNLGHYLITNCLSHFTNGCRWQVKLISTTVWSLRSSSIWRAHQFGVNINSTSGKIDGISTVDFTASQLEKAFGDFRH